MSKEAKQAWILVLWGIVAIVATYVSEKTGTGVIMFFMGGIGISIIAAALSTEKDAATVVGSCFKSWVVGMLPILMLGALECTYPLAMGICIAGVMFAIYYFADRYSGIMVWH